MRLQIKSVDNGSITLFRCWLRSFLLVFGGHIGWISILFNPFASKGQTIWDYLSRTVVVEEIRRS